MQALACHRARGDQRPESSPISHRGLHVPGLWHLGILQVTCLADPGDLPEVPSLESYETTLRDIKQRLVSAGAQVALVSPPVLGEDINSEANTRAAEFAAVVRKACAFTKAQSMHPLNIRFR